MGEVRRAGISFSQGGWFAPEAVVGPDVCYSTIMGLMLMTIFDKSFIHSIKADEAAVLAIAHFQRLNERFLGDFDLAELAHFLFALFLGFEELALAGDVAAVAFGGDVFS
jgi:hypothetical protein